jgi:C-terminal processing protease CtpA/Prc
MMSSTDKEDALTAPVAILVNGQTSGAAEALAMALREAGVALLLGGRTAGQAMVMQEFPLKNGDRLRVGVSPVKLGDGSTMSAGGLVPDIAVQVNPADERMYYLDAFKPAAKTSTSAGATVTATNAAGGTNRPARRPRLNEAELVREHKAGADFDTEPRIEREPEPEKPVVRDPVLARALDLLKGLAVVRHSRP